MKASMIPYEVKTTTDFADAAYDCALLFISTFDDLLSQDELKPLRPTVQRFLELDKAALNVTTISLIPVEDSLIPSSRLFICPIGPVHRDFDDERCFVEAAQAGVKRALKAGIRSILLICAFSSENYPTARLVILLGAMQQLYVPLEVRENFGNSQVETLGLWCTEALEEECKMFLPVALAIEAGRSVARDIGGSDPERMGPVATADYIQNLFNGSAIIRTEVISSQQILEQEYPLLHAVNRAANAVPRHQARVVKLFYVGAGTIKDTLMLVGKGVTLDTGGLNIKLGDCMNGMSRDKCGAAAVVGFFKTIEQLRPTELKVMGTVALVRNSVGPESYSCDEILTSRSRKRVRVVNTDAEGRMIMVDPLCELLQAAKTEVNPHLYTIATLTGHAWLSVGDGYNIVVCNGPAEKEFEAQRLRDAGRRLAEMFEISVLRREDYEANIGQTVYEDLLQSNTQPSVRTPRGHTIPAAFMIMASGLDKHGRDSKKPIKYTHIDMAAGNGPPFPEVPWGSPVATLTARYILHKYRFEH